MTSISVRHLNFLEDKKGGARDAFTLNYFWILVIVGVLGISAAGFSYVQKKRILSLQAQLDAVNDNLKKIKSTQMKKQLEVQNAAALKEVLGDPILWSNFVRKISKKIPESIKLVQVSGTITDKRTLVIKGNSSFLLPIFRLKDNISALKECKQATLVSVVSAEGKSGDEQLSFQMECTLL